MNKIFHIKREPQTTKFNNVALKNDDVYKNDFRTISSVTLLL